MAVIDQGIHAGIHLEDHVAAPAAIAAIGTAVRNIFLPAEGYMSVSAFTAYQYYFCSVSKHGITLKNKAPDRKQPGLNKDPEILLLYRINTGLLSVTAKSLETEHSVNCSEKSIISATSYIKTRMDLGSALSV
jgi:hypothetical protein